MMQQGVKPAIVSQACPKTQHCSKVPRLSGELHLHDAADQGKHGPWGTDSVLSSMMTSSPELL